MKVYLEKAIFINRAPFEKLNLVFEENSIAVLSAVNGKGKTTILSHIVDAIYEMARAYFYNEFENRTNKYYRVSSTIYNLSQTRPSYVYLRFKLSDGFIDFVDIRNVSTENVSTESEYNDAIQIDNKVDFNLIKITQPFFCKFESEKSIVL